MQIPNQTLPAERRSVCPVACGLDLLGDRWTLLVIRDLLQGRQRFKEFMASPEKIPTNILTDRLERLKAGGLIETIAASDGSRFPAYRLTAKGEATRTMLAAVRDWGLRWLDGTRVMISPAEKGSDRKSARRSAEKDTGSRRS